MENKELEQVQEVAEVVEPANGLKSVLMIGGIVLGVSAIAGLGYLVVRKIKARKLATVDTIENSEENVVSDEIEE